MRYPKEALVFERKSDGMVVEFCEPSDSDSWFRYRPAFACPHWRAGDYFADAVADFSPLTQAARQLLDNLPKATSRGSSSVIPVVVQ